MWDGLEDIARKINLLTAFSNFLAGPCYFRRRSQGMGRNIQIFNALGKDKMKEFEESLRPIEKISATRERAEYWMRGEAKDGKEPTYPIYFHKIGEEWKMQNF